MIAVEAVVEIMDHDLINPEALVADAAISRDAQIDANGARSNFSSKIPARRSGETRVRVAHQQRIRAEEEHRSDARTWRARKKPSIVQYFKTKSMAYQVFLICNMTPKSSLTPDS